MSKKKKNEVLTLGDFGTMPAIEIFPDGKTIKFYRGLTKQQTFYVDKIEVTYEQTGILGSKLNIFMNGNLVYDLPGRLDQKRVVKALERLDQLKNSSSADVQTSLPVSPPAVDADGLQTIDSDRELINNRMENSDNSSKNIHPGPPKKRSLGFQIIKYSFMMFIGFNIVGSCFKYMNENPVSTSAKSTQSTKEEGTASTSPIKPTQSKKNKQVTKTTPKEPTTFKDLYASDVYLNLKDNGFDCTGPSVGDHPYQGHYWSTWTCLEKTSTYEYRVDISGLGPSQIVDIRVIALNFGKYQLTDLPQVFGYIASIPYKGSKPDQAYTWAVKQVQEGSARKHFGPAEFEIIVGSNERNHSMYITAR